VDVELIHDTTVAIVRSTPTHRFWVEGRGWTMASDLRLLDVVRQRDGGTAIVGGEETETQASTVYNIEVEDDHSYFVGEFGVLVHNACTQNQLDHIFRNNLHDHNLGDLLNAFGGDEVQAFGAVEAEIEELVTSQGITGQFTQIVSVAGESVTVKGIVINGIVRISTFFIPLPVP
jgi:hypothetical protein